MATPHDLRSLLAFVLTALTAAAHALMGLLGFTSLPLALTAPAEAEPRVRRGRSRGLTPAPDAPGDRFPGMVNLSGTLCYMNSVLQAFASLPALITHLDRIIDLAVDVDVPTPVTDALASTLAELNTGSARPPPALRPIALLTALAPLPQIRRLLATREQQDAHELFVVLAEAISDEAERVAKEVALVRGGLGQALDFQATPVTPLDDSDDVQSAGKDFLRHTPSLASARSSPAPIPPPAVRAPPPRPAGLGAPWEGLLARRRMCRRCGYADVVRMDTLGGMELPVPRSGDVTLDACIAEYLATERLDEVTCDMCTARATAAKYAAKEAGKELAAEKGKPTPSAKKKKAQATRTASRLRTMVESGVPALDTPNIKWETVRTDCVRETAVARAPASLRFHFVRSEYTPYGQLLKKTARVAFPLMFDLGTHMARGVWEPREAGGVAAMLASGAAGPGGSAGGPQPRALYRLQSAILHYGYTHSSGHFVALRRKPCAPLGVPGRGWLRISDADVEEVGTEELVDARAQVFMLFYERVDLPPRVEQERVEDPPQQHPGEVEDDKLDTEAGSDGELPPAAPPTYPPPSLSTLGLPVLPFQALANGPKRSLDSPD